MDGLLRPTATTVLPDDCDALYAMATDENCWGTLGVASSVAVAYIVFGGFAFTRSLAHLSVCLRGEAEQTISFFVKRVDVSVTRQQCRKPRHPVGSYHGAHPHGLPRFLLLIVDFAKAHPECIEMDLEVLEFSSLLFFIFYFVSVPSRTATLTPRPAYNYCVMSYRDKERDERQLILRSSCVGRARYVLAEKTRRFV